MVATGRFQAMGQLDSSCTQPHLVDGAADEDAGGRGAEERPHRGGARGFAVGARHVHDETLHERSLRGDEQGQTTHHFFGEIISIQKTTLEQLERQHINEQVEKVVNRQAVTNTFNATRATGRCRHSRGCRRGKKHQLA